MITGQHIAKSRTSPFAFLVLGGLTIISPYVIGESASIQDVAKRTMGSVVLIVMHDEFGATASVGSGFSVAPGWIATNYHVIEGATSGIVIGVDGSIRSEIVGQLVISPQDDLAIIAIGNTEIAPLPLAKASTLIVGDAVYAVGNPRGQTGTFSAGIISALRFDDSGDRIQTTAPVSPGSSGGPLVDSQGRVVGIITSQITNSQNINFAIPVEKLSNLLQIASEVFPLGSLPNSSSSPASGQAIGLPKDEYNNALQTVDDHEFVIEMGDLGGLLRGSTGDLVLAITEFEIGTAYFLLQDLKSHMPGSMRIRFRFGIKKGPLPFLHKSSNYTYYGVNPPRATASFPGLGSVIASTDTAGVKVRNRDGRLEWFVDNSDHNGMRSTIWDRKVKSKELTLLKGPDERFKLAELVSIKYFYEGFRSNDLVFLKRIESSQGISERELRFPRDEFSKTIVELSGLVIECIRYDRQGITYKVLKRPTSQELRK